LSTAYKLAAEKLTNKLEQLDPANRDGVKTMLTNMFALQSEADQKTLAVNLGDTVLANLNPFGRSRLYTTKSQQALVNELKNIDPTTNLYQVLGIGHTASASDIARAYQKKLTELKGSSQPKAAEQLAVVTRAYQALG